METVPLLRGPILRSVSRSFYLSIRLLPAGLRDPIALAYLLARATDTFADTAEIKASLRVAELARLAARIQGEDKNSDALGEFASQQKDVAERRLIEAVPACLAWLREQPPPDRDDIRAVLLKIYEGQSLDLQRFADTRQVVALETGADLRHYAYLVAGCVGEFWTSVCFRHLPRFAERPVEDMMSLGQKYGIGLQLVNIVRDLGADLRAGRCYLPEDELRAIGVAPEDLRETPARALPVRDAWLEHSRNGLNAGIDYACAIRPFRVRLATVLPALIGARTLALLRETDAESFQRKVKISRAEVRRILLKMLATTASPRAIRDAFETLTKSSGAAFR